MSTPDPTAEPRREDELQPQDLQPQDLQPQDLQPDRRHSKVLRLDDDLATMLPLRQETPAAA